MEGCEKEIVLNRTFGQLSVSSGERERERERERARERERDDGNKI